MCQHGCRKSSLVCSHQHKQQAVALAPPPGAQPVPTCAPRRRFSVLSYGRLAAEWLKAGVLAADGARAVGHGSSGSGLT